MQVEVKQLKLTRGKKDCCIRHNCFEKYYGNVGRCKKYGFEVGMELAKKARVCQDFELHHAMPKGNLTPTKRKGEVEE